MASTTFSGPIRAGTVREGASDNLGNVVLAQSNTVARTDTSAKDLFILPANSQIVDIHVEIGTASDASVSADVTVAITGTGDITNAMDVKTAAGKVAAAPDGTEIGRWASVGTTDATITGIYAETGTASATGGPFTVVVQYIQN